MGMEDGMGMDDGDGMEEEEDAGCRTPRKVTFITGMITGTPTAGDPTVSGPWQLWLLTMTANPAGPNSDVVVDDGNDVPTAINLTNDDSTANVLYQVEVDENDATGVSFGTLSVDDLDSADHPHGQHEWEVNGPDNEDGEEKFEIVNGVLKLKAGESLDHEAGPVITIRVTATDENGDGLSKYQDITVTVNDKNDAPKALGRDEIGDWWVTVDDDLIAEDAGKGDVLTFSIETGDGMGGGDMNPAFTDEDSGDTLTFSISGPAWLEIDPMTGEMTNVKGMLPTEGTHSVTVTATDMGDDRMEEENTDGASASVTFMITVLVSDDASNAAPIVTVQRSQVSGTYTEGSGEMKVGTVSVTDDDFGNAPHPFGVLAGDKPTLSDTANFGLSENYSQNGNTRTWDILVKEMNNLDHEEAIRVTVTATATDGAGATDADDLTLVIGDANEAPEFGYDDGVGEADLDGVDESSTEVAADAMGNYSVPVEQDATATTVLYLNMVDYWNDEDSGDDDDELDFGVSADVSWISVNFGRWGDVKLGADGVEGDPDTTDDVPSDDPGWGPGTEPDDEDMVAIVTIDRTAMGDTSQSDGGTITLTAEDEAGAEGTGTIAVNVTDENVDMAADAMAVRINGSPREGYGLTASFNHRLDPDLANGESPVLVVYNWYTVDDQGTQSPDPIMTSYGTSGTLMLTQAHVGMNIRVVVTYYETDGTAGATNGDILTATAGNGGMATTTDAVVNVQDAASADFVFTTGGKTLQAEVSIDDEDGYDAAAVTYTWQSSVNGVGGWTDVTDADTSDTSIDLSSGHVAGRHYRLVVTYQDEGGVNERIESGTVRIGALDDPDDAPSITGTLGVGGTLLVDSGGGSVQWQKMDDGQWVNITGATGDLTLTDYHGGMTLRALVKYTDANGTTAIVAATMAGAEGADNDATTLEVPAGTANRDPVNLMDVEFTGAVMRPDDEDEDPAIISTFEETVDLASLFQDADGDRLTFTVARGDGGGNGQLSNGDFANLDAATGKLTFITDNSGGHDDDPADGGGNVVTYTVTANDGNGGTQTATVGLRLDVAPTGFQTGAVDTAQVGEGELALEQSVGLLNVQDENDPEHEFGEYEWEVSDGRFEITPDDNDSSQATLTIKEGAEFLATATDGSDATVMVTVTATGSMGDVTHTVTVTVTNSDSDNNIVPTAPGAEDAVPGLKDDDSDGDDEADDNTGTGDDDSDHDGGLPPPDPAMMFEDNLLDEFILAIDDIDIA